jgi:hypothetical protein
MSAFSICVKAPGEGVMPVIVFVIRIGIGHGAFGCSGALWQVAPARSNGLGLRESCLRRRVAVKPANRTELI